MTITQNIPINKPTVAENYKMKSSGMGKSFALGECEPTVAEPDTNEQFKIF